MKRILISAGVFIGVFVLMCLTARLIILTSADVEDGVSDKTSFIAGVGKHKDKDGADKDASDKNDAVSVAKEDEAADNGASGDAARITDAAPAGEAAGVTGEADAGDGGDGESGIEAPDGEPGDETDGLTDDEQSDAGRPHIVCIDAAHQGKADISQEAVGPGASDTKYKVTSGATGTTTGGPEYIVNLSIAKKLKELLIERGYEVVMTREDHDVNISDASRAKLANESADIVIHIHCNADDTRDTMSGIMAFEPSENNTYVDAAVRVECARLGSCLLDKLAAATGAKNWGVIRNDNLTALNWTKIPASHVEVGYLTNPDEDRMLQTDNYQLVIAGALADGVDAFFAEE